MGTLNGKWSVVEVPWGDRAQREEAKSQLGMSNWEGKNPPKVTEGRAGELENSPELTPGLVLRMSMSEWPAPCWPLPRPTWHPLDTHSPAPILCLAQLAKQGCRPQRPPFRNCPPGMGT